MGPGLLESDYEACLAFELAQQGFRVETQKPLPLIYGEVKLEVAREPHTAEQKKLKPKFRVAELRLEARAGPAGPGRRRRKMNLRVRRNAEVVMADYATLLRDHLTLKCCSIDRIFLQAYVPKLQSVGQVCLFLRWQRKFPIPSSAAFGKIGEQYVKAIYEFAEKQIGRASCRERVYVLV